MKRAAILMAAAFLVGCGQGVSEDYAALHGSCMESSDNAAYCDCAVSYAEENLSDTAFHLMALQSTGRQDEFDMGQASSDLARELITFAQTAEGVCREHLEG